MRNFVDWAIWRNLAAAAFVSALTVGSAISQTAISQTVPVSSSQPAMPARPRVLAPGVEQTIPFAPDHGDRHSEHDLIEILATDPEWGLRDWTAGKTPAKNNRFEHKVAGLEFSFKPVRFINVDVPTSEGRMEKTVVWYMVYRVTNKNEAPFRFVPRFLLESWDTQKVYPDRQIPVAMPLIQDRENPPARLLSTIEIAGEIPPSPPGQEVSVWGVAMWEGIDPRTDRFSIFVEGLTNAYKWQDDVASFKVGDPPATGRKLLQKTLQINFWRPSDHYHEHEGEIRYGIPGEVDYRWVYR